MMIYNLKISTNYYRRCEWQISDSNQYRQITKLTSLKVVTTDL